MAHVVVGDDLLIRLAQKLAGNEKKYRDKAVKKLRKWLETKSQSPAGGFKRGDFLKLWKGLHYCMWMSDKPLIQEELARNISGLVSCLKTTKQVMMFVDVFFETEAREWFGIDRLRLDKFMMLIRKVFQQTLYFLKAQKWKRGLIRHFTKVLTKSVLTPSNDGIPDGIRFHIVDIYLDELDTISEGKLTSDRVQMFLEPFCVLLTNLKTKTLLNHVQKRIFHEIVNWHSETAAAIEAMEAMETMETMEEEEQEEENSDDDESPVPQHLTVDYSALASRLFELGSSGDCLAANRKAIYNLVKRFRDLAEGIEPEDEIEDEIPEKGISKADVNLAVHRMIQFEAKLGKTTRLGKKNLQEKRKRKRQRKEQAGTAKSTIVENGLSSPVESPKKKRRNAPGMLDIEAAISHSSNTQNQGTENSSKKKKGKSVGSSVDSSLASNAENSSAGTGKGTESIDKKTRSSLGGDKSGILQQDSVNKKKRKSGDFTEVQTDNQQKISDSPETFLRENKQKYLELMKVNKTSDKSLTPKRKSKDIGLTETPMSNTSTPIHKSADKKKKLKDSKLNGSPSQAANVTQLSGSKEKSPGSVKTPTIDVSREKNESFAFTGGFCSDSDDEEIKTPKKDNKKPHSIATEDQLVSFTKLGKTPPAFVRRALAKAGKTPSTEPRKSSTKILADKCPGSAPGSGKKKVVFEMKKNIAQDFKDSLMVSPQLPYNPKQKPEQGILKASPLVTKKSAKKSPRAKNSKGSPKDSPLVNTPHRKTSKHRPKASDFF